VLDSANQIGEYTFNGAGQRIKKVTQTETRIFHYDPLGHIIAETNQAGQMLAEYIYVGDKLLAMIRPGELAYYFHNDHLGTPQVLTDGTGGIAWKAVYTPFGEAVPSIQTVENPFRFPGQYYDPETGLHYNYFRYYNPPIGRYLTPDPIGLEGGINLWLYATNNPVKFVDPYGLLISHLIEAGIGIVKGGGTGTLIGGTIGGVVGNMIFPGYGIIPGAIVGGAIGSLFDPSYAGQLNYDEGLMDALEKLRAVNKELEEFLSSPEMREFKRLQEEWNKRTGGIVDGKLCK
jgi:RHS repeat-associated protein